MKIYRSCAVGALCLLPFAAEAAELPQLKTSAANTVPACVTPGRLINFVKSRNDRVDQRFDSAAVEYMRHGESLGVRWDYAFFQMLVETGNLGFKGDVKPAQNNFAGLGATGGGVRGESFPDVSAGVKAHLQHILMYAGERIENPVADRTRKVQEWGVLTSWQKSLKGPMTFTQLTKKWSPRDGGYANDIESVAQAFMGGPCKSADPRPELVAEARKGTEKTKLAAAAAKSEAEPVEADAAPVEKESGLDIAKRVVAEARAAGAVKSGLGAATLANAAEAAKSAGEPAQKAPAAVTILNAPKMEPPPAAAETLRSANDTAPKAMPEAKADKPQTIAANAAGTAAKAVATPPAASAATPTKCRVWTASYGGSKAIIIKAVKDDMTNYTVLDVNDGAEKREAEAYIGAYAKGGQMIGDAYTNQDQALDKAFELCPEG